ncbi:MAG: hypothetical protein CL912_00565 [Deltaproteobacteria bacterium]|nr:hypothetical protein [Deltaproteobacteria bacterium]
MLGSRIYSLVFENSLRQCYEILGWQVGESKFEASRLPWHYMGHQRNFLAAEAANVNAQSFFQLDSSSSLAV